MYVVSLASGNQEYLLLDYLHQLASLEASVSLSWLPKSINYLRCAARYGLTRPTEGENSVFGGGGLRSVTNYMGKKKRERERERERERGREGKSLRARERSVSRIAYLTSC